MAAVMGKIVYAFNRLKEPSSYAALAGACAALGINFPDAQFQSIMGGLSVIFGIAGVFIKEYRPGDPE